MEALQQFFDYRGDPGARLEKGSTTQQGQIIGAMLLRLVTGAKAKHSFSECALLISELYWDSCSVLIMLYLRVKGKLMLSHVVRLGIAL